MRVEEMVLRSEIRQMLNEAGINRNTLAAMVRESINDIVKNQVNQVLKERSERDLSGAVSEYLDTNMHYLIGNTAKQMITDKLRRMDFRIDVNVKTEKENAESED